MGLFFFGTIINTHESKKDELSVLLERRELFDLLQVSKKKRKDFLKLPTYLSAFLSTIIMV